MADKTTPDATSSDYDAMLPYWEMVSTILDGADAMRAAGEKYLPKFPNETTEDYDYRRRNAKFTNVYADIVSNLAAKPFAEEVKLDEAAPERFQALAEDIDGRGNSLHVFASNTFFEGMNNAVDWIMVEFTKARPRTDGQPLSIADEKSQGLRPYWVHIPAQRMLAVYADVVGGKLQAVPRAVFAAAAVMQGSRGGIDVPDKDRDRIRSHLAKYYAKLDETPPWDD